MDVNTLHLTDALVNITCSLMCFAIWASRRADRCLALWGMGSLFYGVTTLWFPYLPDGSVGLGLGYSALQVGNIMFWAGYRAYDGKRVLPAWLLALPLLPVAVAWIVSESGHSDVLTHNLTLIVYCGISAGQVVYILWGSSSWYAPRALSAYAVILILCSLLATFLQFDIPDWREMSQELFILTDHAMTIVFTLAVIAMVGQRDTQHLLEMARRDPLTGALNRAGLSAAVARTKTGSGLLLIDIDHFKAINDRHGHDAGDTVLRALVERTLSVLRAGDHLIRMGGEEFLIIASVETDVQLMELAHRVQKAARGMPLHYSSTDIAFTISIGVTLLKCGESFDQAVKRADDALYKAKHSGRDSVALMLNTGLRPATL